MLQVTIVAPVAHQDVLLAQTPRDFRRAIAYSHENEVGRARQVRDAHLFQARAQQLAIGADGGSITPHIVLLPDGLQRTNQREGIDRENSMGPPHQAGQLYISDEDSEPNTGEPMAFGKRSRDDEVRKL